MPGAPTTNLELLAQTQMTDATPPEGRRLSARMEEMANQQDYLRVITVRRPARCTGLRSTDLKRD
jgi:hypothetical protein